MDVPVSAAPAGADDPLLRVARTVFVLLLVSAILPPFVEIAGPLSADDLFPLAAVLIGLVLIPFSRARSVADPSAFGFLLLGVAGMISSAANAVSIPDMLRLMSRSTGRAVFYLCLVLSVRALLDDPKWVKRTLYAFVAAATGESLFGLIAFVTRYRGPWGFGVADVPAWSVLYGHTRVHGTFSGQLLAYENANVSSNFLASYLVMSVLVTGGCMLAEKRWKPRVVLALAALAQLVTLYLTYTRAALVAAALSILAMGWLLGRRKLALGMVVAGVVITLSIPTFRAKFFREGHDRYALWWSGVAMAADHVLTGVGDGNYMETLARNPDYSHTPYGVSSSIAHNSIVLSAASHGVQGGIAHALLYAGVLVVAIGMVRQARGRARMIQAGIASGLIGFLVQDQFNSLAYVTKVATQMWFLFGLVPLVARHLSTEEEYEPDSGQPRVARKL